MIEIIISMWLITWAVLNLWAVPLLFILVLVKKIEGKLKRTKGNLKKDEKTN